jgi:hypothetical protein
MNDEFDWDQLLEGVRRQSIIPVIGSDLLQLTIGEETLSLKSLLTRKLAENVGANASDLPNNPDISDVLCAKPEIAAKIVRNARILYSKVATLYENWVESEPDIQLPEPLLQLAQIRPFRLFVSLTCDDLIDRALLRVRSVEAMAIENERHSTPDINEQQSRSDRPIVFRLFGKFSHHGDYALTDEDMLEFMHWLPSPAHRPINIFDQINQHDLLLLGTGFPDWLARFFLRATRKERLRIPQETTQYVVERHLTDDTRLAAFLRNFSSSTTVYSEGDPVSFVRELHRRCQEENLTAEVKNQEGLDQKSRKTEVFISYASEDLKAAENAKQRLESKGLVVWLDKATSTLERLTSGREFEDQIREEIQQCSLFVALLSKRASFDERCWFRREWRLAVDRLPEFYGTNRIFLVPVLIDETSFQELHIPKEFRDREIKRAFDGILTEDLVRDVTDEVAKARHYQSGGV